MLSPLLGHDALPSEVVIGGRAFPIRHDWRDGVRFETMMFDEGVPDRSRVALALGIWFGEHVPEGVDLGAVIAAMLEFYRCGKSEGYSDEGGGKQLYSYAHDYDAIYAAFVSAYGIDLFDVPKLHWWRFRAMLAALPEDSQFMRIIGYRASRIEPGMSKEQRAHLTKMKRIYALPSEMAMQAAPIRSEEQLRQALHDIAVAKGEIPC